MSVLRFLKYICLFALLFIQSDAQAERPKIDKILIYKSKCLMYLMSQGKMVKSYPIAHGRNRKGTKVKEGDHRTPEGIYNVSAKNPKSRFHKALQISYPRPEDVQQARQQGVNPGGDIMIHGFPRRYSRHGRSLLSRMWTRGCIAVPNVDMDEIWKMVDVGVEIDIRP